MLSILQGDALQKLRELPDESVQSCVTSPPYWGLRDYGTPPQIWGGKTDCEHDWKTHLQPAANGIIHSGGMSGETLSGNSGTRQPKQSDFCANCGAWRGHLGLEPTPELYVKHLASIFREIRRILKRDGTLWLNLGDSYAGSGNPEEGKQATNRGSQTIGVLYGKIGETARQAAVTNVTRKSSEIGLKPKDLIGIPWMVAFALRQDGWYLRSDIIWSKPNPMPESVTDRPTKAHEYLFLLSKSRQYFYDADAIAEFGVGTEYDRSLRPRDRMNGAPSLVRGRHQIKAGATLGLGSETRNKRSVWTVNTQSYADAHFATYPPDLIKPCILAGCPVGGTVLDPFAGSGTTGMVALELGRKAILIELNPEYVELIKQRCDVTPGLALA